MKGIKLVEKDFLNGVKLIRDKNYNPDCNGVTRMSLEFFNHLYNKGYFTTDEVYRADLKYTTRHGYSMTLHTVDGYKFMFHGVSFGYSGEGSRGAKEILEKCGFSNTHRVFDLRHHFHQSDEIKFFKRVS
jgi:hypothetical protein